MRECLVQFESVMSVVREICSSVGEWRRYTCSGRGARPAAIAIVRLAAESACARLASARQSAASIGPRHTLPKNPPPKGTHHTRTILKPFETSRMRISIRHSRHGPRIQVNRLKLKVRSEFKVVTAGAAPKQSYRAWKMENMYPTHVVYKGAYRVRHTL